MVQAGVKLTMEVILALKCRYSSCLSLRVLGLLACAAALAFADSCYVVALLSLDEVLGKHVCSLHFQQHAINPCKLALGRCES